MTKPAVSDIDTAPDRQVNSRPGRRPATSKSELEQVSLALFSEHGFDATSVDDIAESAGIGRRTFFRYFKSKNDAVWGDFDHQLDSWRGWFAACPSDIPLMSAVRRGVVTFNTYDSAGLEMHRRRMRIILETPALQAHSTLRYQDWREVVAEFAAARLDSRGADLRPRVIGHLALGAALAAYEQWLADPASDLVGLLEQALAVLETPEVLASGAVL